MLIEKPLGGPVRPCTCGKQPKHIYTKGRDLHALECPPCGVRTARFPMLSLALQAWETSTVVALAVPEPDPNVLTFRRRA